jgi:acetylornithine deacetylase/succinyl-diaminopimelate desuccinylase-like protein
MRRGAIALGILLMATSVKVSAQPTSPSKYQQLARDIFEQLVEINTSEPIGTTAAAEAMRARLLSAGFPAADVVVMGGAPNKGNLVARLRGRNSAAKPMLLLAHIDVVAANPADWTLPPFELIEKDGVFYGRGTSDDKDEAAIHIANLIRMKEEGYVPERDIVVALTADEETGANNGVRWLVENQRSLIDAEYALNEGGGGLLDGKGARVSNNVQASEKKYADYRFEATNPGGHSSRPRGDNAIYDLARALDRLAGHEFPVRLNDVSREFFRRSSAMVPGERGAAMRTIADNPRDAAAIATLSGDPMDNATMRTTCVATTIEGGHASNALPQRARANVNCRLLPDESPDTVLAVLKRIAGERVTVMLTDTPLASPVTRLDPRVLGPIEKATKEMWGTVPVIPTMSTGATDGVYLRNIGIPAYGVSGLFYPADTGMHGMNERIPVKSFYEGQEFLYRLTKLLSSEPARPRT